MQNSIGGYWDCQASTSKQAKWIAGDNNVIADYLSRDITDDPEYTDYTQDHQEANYIAIQLFTIDNSRSIMNKQIARRNFANTPVRRSKRLNRKKSVDYQIPDESDIYAKPVQGKSTEKVLF